MISKIEFVHYRKLKEIPISFSSSLNAIAGTNGTCKSSLLYIISNSFQSVNKESTLLNDKNCLKVLKDLNSSLNPKIESLVKGDQQHNDPANGTKGTLYTVTYTNGQSVPFRRHDSKQNNRFALKPYYKKGTAEKLPECPVVYLGLSRLLPWGEVGEGKRIRATWLPDEYQTELKRLIAQVTPYHVDLQKPVSLENLKKHLQFSTNIDGIDSNTISSGEDNVGVIFTSLVSLKYYYDCLADKTPLVCSVLLIDELDSTLHPSLQKKMLSILQEYSSKYKIQIVFTTQSASLLRYTSSVSSGKIIYLVDNVDKVALLPHPEWYDIEAHLEGTSSSCILENRKIPLLLEDDEARWMLRHIFTYWSHGIDGFAWVSEHFSFVPASIGCDALRSLFSDQSLNTKLIGWGCILDGDQKKFIEQCVIALPGKNSPERMLFAYAERLANADCPFWDDDVLLTEGFSKAYYADHVKRAVLEAATSGPEEVNYTDVVNSVPRDKAKSIFNEYIDFFAFVFDWWIKNPHNVGEMSSFFNDLKILYKKVCVRSGLPSSKWPCEDYPLTGASE